LAQVATSEKVRAQYATKEAGVESVAVGSSRFFGFQEVERNGLVVSVAETAKVIVDCLYSPEKSGGILEVARIVARGARQTSSSKLVDYAIQMDNRALVQRLGYLADTLDVKLAKRARDQLLKYASQDGEHSFLGSTKVFGTKGNYSRTWRITDNVGRKRLLGELEF
jgi:predicted transcriptional regulator of viral defense system